MEGAACGVDWRESLPEDEARKEEAAAILMTFPSELRTFLVLLILGLAISYTHMNGVAKIFLGASPW